MYYPNISVGTLPFDSHHAAVAAAKLLQSCPTLFDPIDGSPTRLPSPWDSPGKNTGVAISFSNTWKWEVKVKSLSRVRLLATPWTAAHQAPPNMVFSRQEYWSGVPLPSPDSHHTSVSRITDGAPIFQRHKLSPKKLWLNNVRSRGENPGLSTVTLRVLNSCFTSKQEYTEIF